MGMVKRGVIPGLNGVVDYQRLDLNKTKLTSMCPKCSETKQIEVHPQELYNFYQGELIQKAFPKLSSLEREQLLSGYCQKCWDEIFKEEEELWK